jgi:diamine N-acetyltransferase
MSVALRRALPADAPSLAVLAERTFRDTFGVQNSPEDVDLHCARHFGPDIQAREIADRGILTTLAIDSGRLVGFTQLMPSRPQPHVAAEWQGKGVAQALLNEAIADAAAAGADCLWLGVWEHNPRAIAFYLKSGFEAAGSHAFMLGRERQRDLVMSIRFG